MIKVLALIPCYNESEHIGRCIESILSSNHSTRILVEILVSDNASTDNSLSILRDYENKYPQISVVQQESNIGARKNWEFLLQQGVSDYAFFIDAHDYLEADYFEPWETSITNSEKAAFFGSENEVWEISGINKENETKGRYIFSNNPTIRIFQACLYLSHNTITHSLFPLKEIQKNFTLDSPILSFDLLFTYFVLSRTNITFSNKKYNRRYIPNVDGQYSAKNSDGIVETRVQRVTGLQDVQLDDSRLPEEFTRTIGVQYGFLLRSLLFITLKMKHSPKREIWNLFRLLRWLFGRLTPWKAWVYNRSGPVNS
jgi:glycosyltransferase involved in cell wall biosynthesis